MLYELREQLLGARGNRRNGGTNNTHDGVTARSPTSCWISSGSISVLARNRVTAICCFCGPTNCAKPQRLFALSQAKNDR